MRLLQAEQSHVLPCPDGFSLKDTLFCGQCFRFSQVSETSYEGFAGNRKLLLTEKGDSLSLTCPLEDLPFWEQYLDFETDYTALKALFSTDPILAKACTFAPGIRVLRQEPWEALCSFIISQNNNIIRISGIIGRLCSCFGDPIPGDGIDIPSGQSLSERRILGYGFPSPSRLASLSVEELAPLRAGFRAKYILDAARKVAKGEIDLEEVRLSPLEEARERLMQIKGVGVKVAECTLLYGFHRTDAFPVDTWIKKALDRYYPDGFPKEFEPVQGIAQQFLFHYIRHIERKEV